MIQVKKYQFAWFVLRFRCIFPPQQAHMTLPLKIFSLAASVCLILSDRALNSRWILSKVSMSTNGSWMPFTVRFSLPCTSIPVQVRLVKMYFTEQLLQSARTIRSVRWNGRIESVWKYLSRSDTEL